MILPPCSMASLRRPSTSSTSRYSNQCGGTCGGMSGGMDMMPATGFPSISAIQ